MPPQHTAPRETSLGTDDGTCPACGGDPCRATEVLADYGSPGHGRVQEVLRARRHRPSSPSRRPVVDLGAPAPHPWLQEDRPAEHLARLVILNNNITTREKVKYCGMFRDRWGRGELDRAVRLAWRAGPLDETMARLLSDAVARA